jgi:predicted nucleic acid-binding protein
VRIVADSNILFSALISGKELWIDIFRSSEVYVPDFIFAELSKYQEKIIGKTKLGEEFTSFAKDLFSVIKVVPGLAVSQESHGKALVLCNDIDPKDTAYVALSIELEIPLWSNDKKLIRGLANKGYEKIITTEEIFGLLF